MKESHFKKIRSEFQVPYRYDVFFTNNLFSIENPIFANFMEKETIGNRNRKLLILLDEGFLLHHKTIENEIQNYFQTRLPQIQLIPEILVVPGGEESKNQSKYWEKILSAVNQYGIDRHSYLMAIGGGAVLDMVGYAAAISHRGIRLIRVPTTVLSQNDSGVGVKNSINYFGKKNFLGTFSPPIAVFNDFTFLHSLEERDWRSGMAEAIKVSLIKNKTFFEWIESSVDRLVSRDPSAMEYLIYECARLHVEHISQGDPFEFGSSRPLDFGHWFAHKIEYLSDFTIRHGEAVAIGMALDSIYSSLVGDLEKSECDRILSLLKGLGFSFQHPIVLEKGKDHLMVSLEEFREHLGGKLTLLMLEEIGKSKEVYSVDQTVLESAFIRLIQS